MMLSQVDADEILARRLQKQFDKESSSSDEPHIEKYRESSHEKDSKLPANQRAGIFGAKEFSSSIKDPNMSGSDSDATYIEEDGEPSQEKSSKLPANQRAGTFAANQNVAEVKKGPAPMKRSASAHDISCSDSGDEDGSSQETSQSLLARKHDKWLDKKHLQSGSNKGESQDTPAFDPKSYRIPKRWNSSPAPTSRPKKEDKPECLFGAKCYRKNPDHLRDFKHPDNDEHGMPPTKKLKRDDSVRASSSSATSPASSSGKRTCVEVIREASPLSFLLTKVSGIHEKYNNSQAVHISDILAPCMGDLVSSVQFNYMFDIPWLMKQYPVKFRSTPLLIVHGEQRQSKVALYEAAHPYSNIKLCQAKLDIMYGTHHTKMMLLLYTNGMRVVIHTANMINQDWFQKTQGVWISPLFPKTDYTSTPTDSPTFFQRDLADYLTAYRSPSLQEWIGHIRSHDMSEAKVFVVGSIPGRHTGSNMNKWGHLKLRQVLKDHGPKESDVKSWPVIGQFSSVGSLGPDKDKWLCSEWLQSLAQCRGVGRKMQGQSGNKMLKLIFPSKDNVRTSLEGYPAGGSIPYSIKTAKKQLYFNSFLHQWVSTSRGRSRASPHIKTYSRMSPDSQHIAWFLVTSSNMSKAAWGALEKNGQQLMIRSYEMGVLFLPDIFSSESTRFAVPRSAATKESELTFPLPWDTPLVPYSKEDRPWLWDIAYTDLPDSHGNCWVPPT